MKKAKAVEWCVCGPGKNQVQCLRCQAVESIPVPLSVEAFVSWANYFQEKHRYCPEPPTEAGREAQSAR